MVLVDPYNTSQICSGCGRLVPKSLEERWHSCECGTELDRDHNSAIIILFRGEASGPQWYAAVEAHCFSGGCFAILLLLDGRQRRDEQRV